MTERDIESLLESTEGVRIAIQEGEKFYSLLSALCIDLNRPSAGIFFDVKKTENLEFRWLVEVNVNGSVAGIRFQIPYSNSLITNTEGRRDTHIRVNCSNHRSDYSSGFSRVSIKKSLERFYYFTFNAQKQPVWGKKPKTRIGISTEELVEKVLLDVYNFSRVNKSP